MIDSLLVFHMTFPIAKINTVDKTLHPKYSPLILRPELTQAEIHNFLYTLKKLVGRRYDMVELCKAILHVSKIIIQKRQSTLEDAMENTSKLICTEVVFSALMQSSKQFRDALTASFSKIDLATKGYVTPDDFLVL
eukprot:TRINITY_DN4795_c0_g1_i2.p1 TRINITY_DN4795_c0_g1~~TRINITY_DN4795_c0_g1_i2.p1  ORF type:complete len:136 (-),score=27.97 TRINITY_DN4795_c0_g1_i2:457-864(-)